jgi:hypothetical protein
MNEKPILFSAPMIRAILAGRKTQTRRVIKPQPKYDHFSYIGAKHTGPWRGYLYLDDPVWEARCPCGRQGDQLWVRETFAEICELADPLCECEDAAPDNPHHFIEYRADSGNKYPGQWDDAYPGEIILAKEEGYLPRWKPSIFMPRWASRIQLQVESVRVERVQEISPRDAVREGVVDFVKQRTWKYHAIIENFKEVWNSINEDRGYGWEKNPWVWVVEFSLIQEEPLPVNDLRETIESR